jgi:hypothetical protein
MQMRTLLGTRCRLTPNACGDCWRHWSASDWSGYDVNSLRETWKAATTSSRSFEALLTELETLCETWREPRYVSADGSHGWPDARRAECADALALHISQWRATTEPKETTHV